MVITQNILEVLEENNYYPFGLKHQGYNNIVSANANNAARKFMFGGKEYGEELGLDWYDVSARNYDPALGRWMNLDPLAETMRRHSPYNFAFDNPTFYIDPDGMAPQSSSATYQKIESGDLEPMVDIGYGRTVASSKVSSSVNFSSNTLTLNKKGENKLQNNAEKVRAQFNNELKKAFGENVDAPVLTKDKTKKGIKNVIEKVPTLNEIYQSFRQHIPITPLPNIIPGNGDDAITYVTNLQFNNPKMYIYAGAFMSYRDLTETLLHEFGHVTSFLSGNYKNTFQIQTKRWGFQKTALRQTGLRDEMFAYEFALTNGGVQYFDISGYKIARNEIK